MRLAAGGVIVLSLAGCEPQATVVETPAVVWESGAPASEDKFEAAVRASEIGRALAFNLRDFTIEQLTSTTTAERIENMYESFVSNYISANGNPTVKAGPLPYSVLEVTPHGEDAATLKVCIPMHEWWIDSTHPEPEIDPEVEGQLSTYEVGMDDGVLKVIDIAATVDPCDVGELVLGRFDPAPTAPDSITERDIRAPLTLAP